MDIPLILDMIRPGASWAMLGEDKGDYTNLDWRDGKQRKPTQQEIVDAWPAMEAIILAKNTAVTERQQRRARIRARIDAGTLDADTIDLLKELLGE